MEIIGKILILISLITIIINYKNIILILISLELLFIGLSLNILETSLNLDDFEGIINTIMIISLSAIESAVAITILIYRRKSPIL